MGKKCKHLVKPDTSKKIGTTGIGPRNQWGPQSMVRIVFVLLYKSMGLGTWNSSQHFKMTILSVHICE